MIACLRGRIPLCETIAQYMPMPCVCKRVRLHDPQRSYWSQTPESTEYSFGSYGFLAVTVLHFALS